MGMDRRLLARSHQRIEHADMLVLEEDLVVIRIRADRVERAERRRAPFRCAHRLRPPVELLSGAPRGLAARPGARVTKP